MSFKNLTVKNKVMLIAVAMLSIVVFGFTAFMYQSMRRDFFESKNLEMAARKDLVQNAIDTSSWTAYSLAEWVAADPEVRSDFAAGDRQALRERLLPIYEKSKDKINIDKFQFHLPPATSFLRLHKPEKFGDDLTAIRKTIVETNKNKQPVMGLDRGKFGFGIRGVVPVSSKGEHIGSLEFGVAFNNAFLESIQKEFGFRSSIVVQNKGKMLVQASTMAQDPLNIQGIDPEKIFSSQSPRLNFLKSGGEHLAYYLAPIRDYADKTVAVLVLPQNITESMQSMQYKSFTVLGIGICAIILFPLILFWLLNRLVTKPLAAASDFANKMSRGDMTGTLHIDSKDEIGKLAQALSTMAHNWREVIINTNNGVETMDIFSGEMNKASQNLSSGSDSTSEKANTVASAAEEMSTNMNSVASAMEQTSTNVNNLASSAEEMSTTISDIADNADKTRKVTKEAVSEARKSSQNITRLGKAAQEIDKVSESIAAISSQTDLLALNATIEAARAGEAGKGFAVVAGEIKELARQSAEATEDIAQKVKGIQDVTENSVSDIENVAKIINKVDEYVESIAASVEEQSAATQEIADNVAQSSEGVGEVNEHVNQSSTASSQIAEEIAQVNSEARDISALSTQIDATSRELSSIAVSLREMLKQFKIGTPLFEIGTVKSAHLKWRTRLESLIHGDISLNPEEIASDHECDFGKWYYSDEVQDRLGEMDIFKELGKIHADLHTMARKIAVNVQEGNMDKARVNLEKLEEIRKEMFDRLDKIYQRSF
ncbi:MAG: cache domain-containing protein [Thermodesulfobacteriota bacterium]